VETKSGEHVIVDPALTMSHVYMYFYLFLNVGALVGQITMVYAEKVCLLFYFIQDAD
jgi:POT family proton-dependent oligopeptide transporter